MQELVGRITALDPQASETLKVVAYFDALSAAGVGLSGLLRGAAALSGVAAGAERRGRITRLDPAGRRLDTGDDIVRSPECAGPGGRVWLERREGPQAHDEMIVERLALAVELAEARLVPGNALDVALDPVCGIGERAAALARLRIDAGTRVRLVATSIDDVPPGAPSTIVPTRYGMLRATLDVSGEVSPGGRAGLGPWARADHAPESWAGAVVAHRLTDPADPVVDATGLGAMLLLAQAYDVETPHDDVRALGRLDTRSAAVLRVLVEADSIRAAAAELGLHHSTVQARHEAITRELGYDPRTPTGRMRYAAAGLLLRLSNSPGPSAFSGPQAPSAMS
ncbi:helix-turn-helix domain-containing protein [Streptomyces sp. NPDC052095]|uniref:helix-turn-helix domain-containing protein n=1 Tax=unclassified Streptomyces TaxID=2593676 RepID=UPI00344BB462